MSVEKSSFAEARVIASRALDLAQRHRTPPFPRTYEVWFSYAGGQHDALAARLDEVIAEGRDVSAALIDELYGEFLSPEAMNAGMERIGDRVQAELGEVIDVIEGGVDGGEKLAAAITRAEEALSRASTPAEQAQALERLRSEQRRHQRAANRLGENLGSMRAQFLSMQQELRELRQSVLLDAVTQLPNARFFEDAVSRLIAEGMPDGGTGPASCLVLVEIESLSEIRRACGRSVADGVLSQTAGLLRRVLHDGDVAIRLETDRFALVLRSRDSGAMPRLLDGLERAIGAIRLRRITEHNEDPPVIAAAGMARLAARDTVEGLMDRAEQAQAARRAARTPSAAE